MNICLIGDGVTTLILATILANNKADIPLPIKHIFIIKI